VKWRLLWLRTEHPDAEIATEMTSFTGDAAVFRAKVTIPGGGSATGWGQEQYSDFRDFVEKAETKALGRALAALGFGTQFATDFDEGTDRVVDAPVATPGRASGSYGSQRATNTANGRYSAEPATDKQLFKLGKMYEEQGVDPDEANAHAKSIYGAVLAQLSKAQASDLIKRLGGDTSNAAPAPSAPPPPSSGQDQTLFAWLRNISNARTAAALENVITALQENGLRLHPEIDAAVTKQKQQIMGQAPARS